MKLAVHVLGREVATLESVGDFKSMLRYLPETTPADFVSLTMPVRNAPYEWDDVLLPFFQMNLPEGYLLRVLQEQFGPVIGGSPTALLAVVGRNMIGRVQVAAPGSRLDEPARAVDVKALLAGDQSEQAFAALVREHATSGVSGVVPKFLDTEELPARLSPRGKVTVYSHRHIIKRSSDALPFISLNEHLCMEVARRVMPAARTQVSDDGQILVVDRFDVDDDGRAFRGMEDFCALLGLRPAAKYDTTWERVARAVRDLVPAASRQQVFRDMASLMLLTHALRNADCHAKNVALTYTSRDDIALAPAYDMITTSAYAGYANSPPSISFMGKKTWAPGRHLQAFIASTFLIPPREQHDMLERIAAAMKDVGPEVRGAMARLPAFQPIGQRMLDSWCEGITSLFDKRTYALGDPALGEAFH